MDYPEVGADDVLAQPTRARLFARLGELDAPATTRELAARLGLHPNGVRRHLARLESAGLINRESAEGGRGRPADRWSLEAGARPGGQPARGYGELARWLARAIPARPDRRREVERAGRAIGGDLAPAAAESPSKAFLTVLTNLGLEPLVDASEEGTIRCRFCNCPYRDSARENAEIVCALHRGITEGLLERLAPEAQMSRFEPKDPDVAGCLVEVTGIGSAN